MSYTVIPSFLSSLDGGAYTPSGYDLGTNDSYVRIGRVSKVHAPKDTSNHSKKFFEYDVEVDIDDGSGSYTKLAYPRTRILSAFGAVADYSHFTPRVVSGEADKINQGSLVLVVCINGDSRQAIILGGIQHPSLPVESPEDGHHRAEEFNGAGWFVNKDGELTIKFRGATNADGTLSSSAVADAEGSNLNFAKDGSVEVQTADDKQHLRFDHPNGNTHLQGVNEVRIKVKNTVIEADTTKIGGDDAADALIKGTTYRQAEQQMHQTMLAQLQALTTALTQVSSQLITAGGMMVTPTTGAVSAAPVIAAAGAGIATAVAAAQGIAQAISEFEAGSDPFLSKKNSTD